MRVFSFIAGLVLIGGIILLGYYTNSNADFVTWFGVITCLVSPLAFELLFFPFKAKDQEIIKELSKIPKIEEMLKQARDNEEKIIVLEKQKAELDKLIAYEAKRKSLEAKKHIFYLQGQEALKGINSANVELEQLTGERQELPEVLAPLVNNIHGDRKDVITYSINKINYIIRRSSFGIFPLYGPLLFDLLKAFEVVFKKIDEK